MRIKVINLPDYNHYSVTENCYQPQYPSLPSAVAVISSLLRENGFKTDQDDLNAKLFYENTSLRGEPISIEPFADKQRMDAFFNSGGDPEIKEIGERILKLTKTRGYDLIAFSASDQNGMFTDNLLHLLSHLLKREDNPYILVGGRIEEDTSFRLLKEGCIDFSLRMSLIHPGHTSVIALCNSLERGKNLHPLPGFTSLCDGRIRSSESSTEVEPFTTPDFEGLPLELYQRNRPAHINGFAFTDDLLVLPINFIRGCQFGCSFCSHSYESGWYAQEPDEVAEMLSRLLKRYNTPYFYFLNSSVNPTKDYARRLSDAIKGHDLNILWTDCANFHNIDGNLLERLSEAGAARLVFGMESASPRLLKFVRKPLSIAHAESMLKETTRHRIWTELDFIAGLPTEDQDDLKLTTQFLQRNIDYYETCDTFKFWLEGDFRARPKRYHLQIIQNQGSDMVVPSGSGIGWHAAVQRIEAAFEATQRAAAEKNNPDYSLHAFPFRSDEHLKFIYHLSSFMYPG